MIKNLIGWKTDEVVEEVSGEGASERDAAFRASRLGSSPDERRAHFGKALRR